MSGIYIKGMKMPKEGTVFAVYKLQGKFYVSMRGTEPCPLIPVPDHGRLIDADALCEGLVSNHPVVIHAKCAPTVIQADKEGE